MSFNCDLQDMEQLRHYKDSACSAGRLWNKKKENIEQKYPLQYALYQKNKEMKKMRDRLIGQVEFFAFGIIYPNGMNVRCHSTVEECHKNGEQFIENRHFHVREHLPFLLDTIQEFRKYPDFEECIQDDAYWKECFGSKCSKVEAYFQGMLFRIRKDFKQVTEPELQKKEIKETEPLAEPATGPATDPVLKPKKEKKVKKTEPLADPVPEPVTEKAKKKSIPSTVKRLVWNKNIGEEIGKSKCYCCKTTYITQSSFHCGHVISEAKGGETIVNNLKPICQNCNSSMGSKDMNEFMISLG